MARHPYFIEKNGRLHRTWWDNVFCHFCGKELTPEESYGNTPAEPGICWECMGIILTNAFAD